jgi:hypothetical protein
MSSNCPLFSVHQKTTPIKKTRITDTGMRRYRLSIEKRQSTGVGT